MVETIGAPLPSGEMTVSLGGDAVSVCVTVTTLVTEMVEVAVVVEASQDPLASFWGEATRLSIDPAVARVAMYAKAAMADVGNFISDDRCGKCFFLVSNQRAPVLEETERVCCKEWNAHRACREREIKRMRLNRKYEWTEGLIYLLYLLPHKHSTCIWSWRGFFCPDGFRFMANVSWEGFEEYSGLNRTP
jgi:hypothetical protein